MGAVTARRGARVFAPGVLVAALVLAACGTRAEDVRDAREADAVGTVAGVERVTDGMRIAFAPDAGYEYFEGTTFEFDSAGDLETADGDAAGPADVAVGDRIEVWVDACAESYPVQCPDPVGRLLP